jgi:hypothetical protein
MKIFYCDHFVLPLPEKHRFPMQKYSLLRERVTAQQVVPPGHMQEPEPATDAQLSLAHSVDYIERVKSGSLSAQEIRRMGFPWSPSWSSAPAARWVGRLGPVEQHCERGSASIWPVERITPGRIMARVFVSLTTAPSRLERCRRRDGSNGRSSSTAMCIRAMVLPPF